MADENDNDTNMDKEEVPVKYTKLEVGERLSDEELEELNKLVDDFDEFSMDPDDPRYKRWKELDDMATG